MVLESVSIRKAKTEDMETLASFNEAMALETEDLHLNPETVRAGVRGLLNDPTKGFYLVATLKEQVVASLMVTYEWSDWRDGTIWWIQSVYVAPDSRRQGIYRSLYNKVKDLAESDTSVCGFRLYVEKDNKRAQDTYASLGMSETHYKIFEEMCP